jgi:DNA-binding transcriptional LysR family regulator
MAMDWTDRIGRRVKLRDLHVLLAVAQWGSMAQAARHLSTSQPVISKTIAELEHALGVRLLDRSPHGIVPTMYGRALMSRGLAIFDELREGIKEIEFLADPAAGELRVGSPETMNAGLLPAITERLAVRHPRVILHVVQANTVTEEFRELRERSVDLMLGRVSRALDDDLEAEVLYEDRLFVVAASDSPWARRRKLTLADLAGEPWVNAPADSIVGSYLAEVFAAQGLRPPQVSVVSFSMYLRNMLLASGRYVAMVPGSVLRFSAERFGLRALAIPLPETQASVSIITLKGRTLSPVARVFAECAREVAKPVAQWLAHGNPAARSRGTRTRLPG